jgi:hypothetical protein
VFVTVSMPVSSKYGVVGPFVILLADAKAQDFNEEFEDLSAAKCPPAVGGCVEILKIDLLLRKRTGLNE